MSVVVAGGTGGLGLPIARRLLADGARVTITSRDAQRAERAARELGDGANGVALDLAHPAGIAGALSPIASVDGLIVAAIEQSPQSLGSFDVDAALAATAVKITGTIELVRGLRDRFTPEASVVLFGGLARDRPYPGSTIVTTLNQAVSGLARTLAVELAPTRVNAIHPGIVGDSPKWRDVDVPGAERAPIGRLVRTDEIIDATVFLLRNRGISGQDLRIDGGMTTV